MKKFFIVLLTIFLSLSNSISYGAQDKKDSQKAPKEIQPSRPILPPVISPSSPAIGPTPSPHIASPQISPQVINTSVSSHPDAQFPQGHMQNIPSFPARVTVPGVPVPTDLPKVPIIGSCIGRVVNTGSEKNRTLWIDVKDDLFNETLRIRIKDKDVPIIKQGSNMSFKDVKTGGGVNVIFSNENEENVAIFITILTEKDLESARDGVTSELTVTTDKSKDIPGTATIPEEK